MALEEFTEGETGPIDEILQENGAGVDLTGKTVTVHAWDRNHKSISLTGVTSVRVAASGKVRFVPSATDLKATSSPIYVRWMAVNQDGTNLIVFPRGAPVVWEVRNP